MMNVLFINSRVQECGVHQFGLNLARVLGATRAEVGGQKSEDGCYRYCEPATDDELLAAISTYSADILLYNFYPCTMQWVTLQTLNKVRALGLKQLTIFHETPVTGFDAFIYPDPTFVETSRQLNDWLPIGRPLPKAMAEGGGQKSEVGKKKGKKAKRPTGPLLQERVPIIGSAGFGFGWKGHVRLVEKVVAEFEKAKIRLHLPFAKFGDADGIQAKAIAEECRTRRAFSNIELEISHDFMEPDKLVEWLAGNDLNAFLYDDTDRSRGIASTIDHALAARRPIAVTRSWMFRHLWDVEGIFVEDSPLSAIMARGIEPLRPIYERFSDEKVRAQVEEVIGRIGQIGPMGSYNRLLTNADRESLAPTVEEMREAEPELMARKIPEANVQQAWTLEMIGRVIGSRSGVGIRRGFKILCAGCFEDPTFQFLNRWLGAVGDERPTMVGTDPASNGLDLASYRQQFPAETFDCIFATSVLEHVEEDEEFIRDVCLMLKPDGVALLTVDFKADYKPGDAVPATSKRFYTPADYDRLGKVMEQQACYWLDRPQLDGASDFVYQGHHYSFATMVIKHL
jgi:SAM-dependent methyltransferase